jgi:hypothetical protein
MLMVLWIAIGLVAGGLTGSFMKRCGFANNWGLWLDTFVGAGGALL